MENTIAPPPAKWRSVEVARGTAWWTESWALFMKNPGIWVLFGIIFIVGLMVLNIVPMIGGLAAAVLAQVILGGWMMSARKAESGGALEAGDLFAGFKDKLNPLLVLGALAAVASIVIFMVTFFMGGSAFLGMMLGGVASSTGGVMAGAAFGLLALLVGLALGFVAAMAFWFAPALVVFRDTAPIDALKASWSGSLANVGACLVYGVIWIAAGVVASIPFGLGWIVLMPLTVLGIYASYKDIFENA